MPRASVPPIACHGCPVLPAAFALARGVPVRSLNQFCAYLRSKDPHIQALGIGGADRGVGVGNEVQKPDFRVGSGGSSTRGCAKVLGVVDRARKKPSEVQEGGQAQWAGLGLWKTSSVSMSSHPGPFVHVRIRILRQETQRLGAGYQGFASAKVCLPHGPQPQVHRLVRAPVAFFGWYVPQ